MYAAVGLEDEVAGRLHEFLGTVAKEEVAQQHLARTNEQPHHIRTTISMRGTHSTDTDTAEKPQPKQRRYDIYATFSQQDILMRVWYSSSRKAQRSPKAYKVQFNCCLERPTLHYALSGFHHHIIFSHPLAFLEPCLCAVEVERHLETLQELRCGMSRWPSQIIVGAAKGH